jgi:hypothetical protein
MLRRCNETLVHFEFQGFCPVYKEEDDLLPLLTFPVLANLKIGFTDDIIPFIDIIAHHQGGPSMPQLTDLTIKNLLSHPETPQKKEWGSDKAEVFTSSRVLLRAFTGITPNLRSLSLYGLTHEPCHVGPAQSFFAAIPLLQSLKLYCVCDVLFSALYDHGAGMPVTDRPPLLPMLQDLTVTNVSTAIHYLRRRTMAKYPKLQKINMTRENCLVMRGVIDLAAHANVVNMISNPLPGYFVPEMEMKFIEYSYIYPWFN